MRKTIAMILVCMFGFIGCATNPVVNGRNVGGLVGASGGAYGGSVLCKNCKGIAKVASIGGGALIGWLVGSKVGEYFDKKDRERQIDLIQSVAENNKDNQTSTTQYSKTWRNPNTGQQQTGTITQSATPLNTIQPNRNPYLQNDIQPLRRRNNGVGQSLYSSNNSVCRDMEITVSVDIPGGPPSKQQFFRTCRTEQGWRSVD
jgi:hypothetical protein